jgi:predicted Zn-dependent protease
MGFARARSAALTWAAGFVMLAGCVSQEREQEMGDIMAAEINAQLPLLQDPLLVRYVERVGAALAQASERPSLDYHFYIINTEMVNAFALPGGHIYLTRGLIEKTRSEAELAGVVAHEVGHVAARHGVQKLERNLRTGSLIGVLYETMLGGEPEILRRNGLRLAGVLWNASHSREDEEEADRLAVKYLVKTGIDPRGVVTLLETLLREEVADSQGIATWFSTHPMTQARIRVARDRIAAELGDTPPRTEHSLPSFAAFRRRVDSLPPPPDALEPRN